MFEENKNNNSSPINNETAETNLAPQSDIVNQEQTASPIPKIPLVKETTDKNTDTSRMSFNISNNGIIKKALLILIGILIVGGIVYGGYWSYDKFIANTPEKVMAKSAEAMSGIKAVGFNIETKFITPEGIGKNIPSLSSLPMINDLMGNEINISAQGQVDGLKTGEEKMKLNLGLSLALGTIKVSLLNLNKDLYFQINELPAGVNAWLDPNLLTNKWIQYSLGDKQVEAVMGDKNKVEQIKQLLMVKLPQILVLDKNHGVEMLDGSKAYHYTVTIDKDKFMNLAGEINNLLGNGKDSLTAANLTEEDWQKLGQFQADVWFDKKNYYLRKIYIKGDEAETKTQLDLTLEFDNFNQPLLDTAPTNYMSVENWLASILNGDILGGFLGGEDTTEETNVDDLTNDYADDSLNIDGQVNYDDEDYYYDDVDDLIDTDEDGLFDYEENGLWGTDPNNPDTDGDGYNDGEEIKNGYDPLIPGNARLLNN